MKRLIAIILIILALFPTTANAEPVNRRGKPRVTKDGVTYVLIDDCAAVTKVANKKVVTIPKYVYHKGRKYEVLSIDSGTLSKCRSLRTVHLKADLEECCDDTFFRRDGRKVTVHVYDWGSYCWLKRSGNANVRWK